MILALLLACGLPEPGVDYRGTRLPVTDMHLHTGTWELIPEDTQQYLASRFPFPFGLRPEGLADRVLTAEGVVGELDAAGISRGMLFAVYAPRTVGVATNEFVAAQVAEAPERLVGLASLPVEDWTDGEDAALEQLSDALEQPGMVGIKLAHPHMHMRLDDDRYWGIYEVAAAHAAPVYLHIGTSPFPGIELDPEYTDPAWVADTIAAHPEVEFILGHLGYDFVNDTLGELDTCIALAQAHDNVWLEPSALGSRGGDPTGENLPEALRRIREAGVADRVIYGSDGPQSPGFVADYLDRTLTAFDKADYDADQVGWALSGAHSTLFGLEAVAL